MTFQTDDWLIVPPGARNKRSVKDDPSLGTIDADGLVYGCEDAEYIAFDDELLIYEDVVELIKDRKKCCKGDDYNGQIRAKRQFTANGKIESILWKMPLIYSFSIDAEDDLIENVDKALITLSELTCLKFERVGSYSPHDIEFVIDGKGCWSYIGNDTKTKSKDTNITSQHINVPWNGCGGVINILIMNIYSYYYVISPHYIFPLLPFSKISSWELL
uniref:Peptidase M12A domain-containing protein n=1 Tax=Meloidogyne incognita TaxID=6306 RepID=A0A914MA21_MELIC